MNIVETTMQMSSMEDSAQGDMRPIFKTAWKNDYRQDIEIINQWTDMLGLKGWYYWTDFEDVPSDYLQSY